MTPSSLAGHVVELLDRIVKTDLPADKTISDFYRQRKYLGSHDRRWITDKIYGIIRNFLLLKEIGMLREIKRVGLRPARVEGRRTPLHAPAIHLEPVAAVGANPAQGAAGPGGKGELAPEQNKRVRQRSTRGDQIQRAGERSGRLGPLGAGAGAGSLIFRAGLGALTAALWTNSSEPPLATEVLRNRRRFMRGIEPQNPSIEKYVGRLRSQRPPESGVNLPVRRRHFACGAGAAWRRWTSG